MPICRQQVPALRDIDQGRSACFLTNEELDESELDTQRAARDESATAQTEERA